MNRPLAFVVAVVVAALVFAAGGFVAGMTIGKGQAPEASTPGRGAATRQSANPGRNATSGQVLNVGDGTVTIQLGTDLGSRILLVSPTTRIVRTTETEVKLNDLKVGDRVTVLGQENADGSISAQAIVIGGANVFQQILGGSPRPSASPGR